MLITALIALGQMATAEGVPGLVAVADAGELARDPDYELPPGSAALLRRYGLTGPDGSMHDLTRQAILADGASGA